MQSGATPFPVDIDPTTPSGYRIDIQLLRALAILFVLLQHADVPGVQGGFLGVDVFFVISGYLMTGIIARGIDRGNFSFRGFYARRIRRLAPACYAMLVVVALAAPFLLDSYEYADFLKQLAGSFAFSANIVLWKLTDYFNTAAAVKPLLHMWSLSLEEQYYLLLPIMLFAVPAQWRLGLMVTVVAASIALAFVLFDRDAAAIFYLLPFRAWEMGIGSVVALLVGSGRMVFGPMWCLRTCALAVMLVVPFFADDRHHPGIPAMAVCVATAILLLPGLKLRPSRAFAPLTAIGDRSYSLYLVHWPLFAFANNIWLASPPPDVRLGLVAVAFLWCELQYRFAEQPLRRLRITPRAILWLLAIPALGIGATYVVHRQQDRLPDEARAYNLGLSPACNLKSDFTFQSPCRTGAEPQMLIWGDSFAMHIAPGLAASAHVPVGQATRTVCGPFLGIAPINKANSPRWARRCIAFNDSVISALARAPRVRTVVLSSALSQYVPEAEAGWQVLLPAGQRLVVGEESEGVLLASIARTVDALHRLGKRVVLVAPPPSAGFDIGRCYSRLTEHKPLLPSRTSCDFERARYIAFRAPTLAFLAAVVRSRIVPIFRFDDALCGGGLCRTTIGGTLLYRDGDHFSVAGSRKLGRRIDLADQLETMAR